VRDELAMVEGSKPSRTCAGTRFQRSLKLVSTIASSFVAGELNQRVVLDG